MNLGLIMLDTALFILEGVLLKEKARPTWDISIGKPPVAKSYVFRDSTLDSLLRIRQDMVKDKTVDSCYTKRTPKI